MSAAGAASASREAHAGFRHEALLYAGEREFLAGTLPFLRDGIALGQPALVVVAPRKIAALRGALGDDARHVRFEDMATVGANPARIISAWHDFREREPADGGAVRGIGEPVWAGRSAAELVECHRHESLLNLAFADARDFRLLCPYDTDALDADVIGQARRTHPVVAEGGASACASADYHGLEAAAAPCEAPLAAAPPWADELAFDARGLVTVRAAVTRHGARAALPAERIEDLVLAVNELATNSVVHGGGRGVLRVWMDEGADPRGRVAGLPAGQTDLAAEPRHGSLTCEVRDAGTLDRPLAGRRRPGVGQAGHYGLWLVNQLCDLVEQRTPPGGGNVVRVTMRREP